MKKKKSLLALVLSALLALSPVWALADGTYLPEGEVAHAEFTLSAQLNAEAFPDANAHYADWAAFLDKLRLKGSLNALDFLNPESRVYLSGNVQLNGEDQLPFVYDGYHSYRYFISPLFANEVLHFQMHNFFQFMLKPYYYWEMPTNLLALALYPEASQYIGAGYYDPVAAMIAEAQPAQDGPTAVLGGNATALNVPYERLYELCEQLDLLVNDDGDYERVYYYLTCLLAQTYMSDSAVEALGRLEDWLDYLDPEQGGLTIVDTVAGRVMTLGENTLFEKQNLENGAIAFKLSLPNEEGYTLAFDFEWTPGEALGAALNASLRIELEGEERIGLTVTGDGLPKTGDLSGEGTVELSLTGAALEQEFPAQRFAFDWVRDASQPPYHLDAALSWLHPETAQKALTLRLRGDFSTVDQSVFVEGDYPQNDFFNLNEGFLEEYKARFTPTIALSAVPFMLEAPSGVIDDLFELAQAGRLPEILRLE
ncbi:MAG: hypothetical protein PHY12_00710 [Eubacteriales bacterium]|nr:hypothetical protein [Eubacteriales bacterium]